MIAIDITSPVFPRPTWHATWDDALPVLKRVGDGWKFFVKTHENGDGHVQVVAHWTREEIAVMAATF